MWHEADPRQHRHDRGECYGNGTEHQSDDTQAVDREPHDEGARNRECQCGSGPGERGALSLQTGVERRTHTIEPTATSSTAVTRPMTISSPSDRAGNAA